MGCRPANLIRIMPAEGCEKSFVLSHPGSGGFFVAADIAGGASRTTNRQLLKMILIVANGNIEPGDWWRDHLQQASSVIAADGGLRHLLALEALPDLVIGDLDSSPPDRLAQLEENGIRVLRYPTEKDETDLELALVHAANADDEEIFVLGALGGRLDQTLANILLLAHPALAQTRVYLLTRHQRAWLIAGEETIHGSAGDRLSLIPLGGDAQIAATTNLRWELANERLLFGPARGLSNVMTADTATIKVQSGQVLCVHTDREWER